MFALPKRFHSPKNLVAIINFCAEQVVVGICEAYAEIGAGATCVQCLRSVVQILYD